MEGKEWGRESGGCSLKQNVCGRPHHSIVRRRHAPALVLLLITTVCVYLLMGEP